MRDRAKTEVALAPALWRLEVANVLVLAEKRGRIWADMATEFVYLLEAMQNQIDPEGTRRTFEHIMPLFRRHDLTAYDAAYLDLALREGLPLATLDARLRSVAAACGVDLLGLSQDAPA